MIENELEKQMSKTAHWIKVQGRPHHARCDSCDKVTKYAWGMDYCPKCGRKMKQAIE